MALPRTPFRPEFSVDGHGNLAFRIPGGLALALGKARQLNAEEACALLRDLRDGLQLSTAGVASLTGGDFESARGWLTGRRRPSGPSRRLIGVLHDLAERGMAADELLTLGTRPGRIA